MAKPEYKIIKGTHAPCELRSYVKGKVWGGTIDKVFDNFVCDGTYTHCNNVKETLEASL